MSVVYGLCNPVQALLRGGAHGRPRVQVKLSESKSSASAELVHQHGLALLKHIWRAWSKFREKKTWVDMKSACTEAHFRWWELEKAAGCNDD